MCWELRQELRARTPSGKNGWVLDCIDCALFEGSQACWEQCAGSPCCCAPLSVTCDFCDIYIVHRREIADLLHSAQVLASDDARPASTLLHTSPLEGGKPLMEKIQFGVPSLWADHHTLKVREVLSQMTGVQDIVASPAFRMVAVSYDPAVVTPDAIAATLEEAGYPVAIEGMGVVTQPVVIPGVPVQDGHRDPAWNRLGMRQFRTDERDLKTKR